MKWVVLLAAIGTNVVASILLKIAVVQIRKLEVASPVNYIFNLNVWLGIVAYGLSFIFYIVALGLFPLNVANPVITSAALISIAIASVLIFKESFDWVFVVGIALVLGGIILLASRSGQAS
jgi:multidrug transporter EmrE-like cation transporter